MEEMNLMCCGELMRIHDFKIFNGGCDVEIIFACSKCKKNLKTQGEVRDEDAYIVIEEEYADFEEGEIIIHQEETLETKISLEDLDII